MTEVLHSSPSSSSPSIPPPAQSHRHHSVTFEVIEGNNEDIKEEEQEQEQEQEEQEQEQEQEQEEGEEEGLKNKDKINTTNQLSLLALLVALFRKSFWVTCNAGGDEVCTTSRGHVDDDGIEIGHPTNVHHVSHVTFDGFNGFLGLPVEFEPDVPKRAPSASTTVFGVSAESMQVSFDHRGNSIPTILLQMQKRLYSQGGLQAEGIFRINGGNSQNEYVRDQLNRGVVPESIDVHCLAGLIKTWFRELPRGVLDPLPPERVVQCQLEEECIALVRLLPPTETALLDWSINLMADVVQEENLNKMNSRNIAMVFAPNMTQMSDPLTALMYAVQVMNFLRTLIERALRERQDTAVENPSLSQLKPSDEDGQQKPSQLNPENVSKSNEAAKHVYFVEEPDSDTSVVEYDSDTVSNTAVVEYNCDTVSVTPVVEHDSGTVSNTSRVAHDSDTSSDSFRSGNMSDVGVFSYSASAENSNGSESCETPIQDYIVSIIRDDAMSTISMDKGTRIRKRVQSSDTKEAKSTGQQRAVQSVVIEGKSKGFSSLSHIDSITERVEAWRR